MHRTEENKEEYNEYYRRYMLNRYYERRAAAIEKLGGKCSYCGSIEGLEFDHIDPDDKLF
jgi:5-methylcytosine-specific restriction endonuclease McrA